MTATPPTPTRRRSKLESGRTSLSSCQSETYRLVFSITLPDVHRFSERKRRPEPASSLARFSFAYVSGLIDCLSQVFVLSLGCVCCEDCFRNDLPCVESLECDVKPYFTINVITSYSTQLNYVIHNDNVSMSFEYIDHVLTVDELVGFCIPIHAYRGLPLLTLSKRCH